MYTQPMTTSTARTLLLALALAAGNAAFGQEGQTNTTPSAEAPPSVRISDELFVAASLPYAPTSNTIATKLPVDLAWTPANVGVVGNPAMDEQGVTVLGDALNTLSSLNAQPGAGFFDFFVLRGFDSLSGALLLSDGAPEPEVTLYQAYNVERVEVYKGPTSFLYGSDAMAGTVNLVRKQPIPARFGTVSLEGGSFATYGGSVDGNLSLNDDADLRVNGLYRRSDGFREGKDSRVWAVNPALTYRFSPRTWLNANFEVQDFDAQPDAGLPLVGGVLPKVSRDNAYESPFDGSTQRLGRHQIDVESQLSERLTLRNKTYYRRLDWASDGTLLFGAFPNGFGGFAVARALTSLDDDQTFYGNQAEAVISARTGAVEHKLLTGVEIARREDEFTLDVAGLPFVDLVRPVTRGDLAVPLPGQFMAGDRRTTIVSPYAIDQMVLGPKVQVLVGARYDDIRSRESISDSERNNGEFSPMVGAVFAPAGGWSLYANLARGFAPASPRIVGDVEPERSTQVEVGLRRELLGGKIRSTLALYQLERENIGIPDDNGFTQQAGDQRVRGAELELSAALAPRFDLIFSYAYTDSELTRFAERLSLPFPPFFLVVDRSGNRAAFAPEHAAQLWLSKRFAGGLMLAGGARYLGEQFIAEDNAAKIDASLLLDAAASYTLGDLRLTLNAKNLTDEETETRAFGAASVIPGRPRSFTLRVDYRF